MIMMMKRVLCLVAMCMVAGTEAAFVNCTSRFTSFPECDRKTFLGNDTVLCPPFGCKSISIRDHVVMTCEYECPWTYMAGDSRAICGLDPNAKNACYRIWASQRATVICDSAASCDDSVMNGQTDITCRGQGSCTNIRLFDEATASCIGDGSCLQGYGQPNPGELSPHVCPAGQFGFSDSASPPCLPCPEGTVGMPYPGRGPEAARCHCLSGNRVDGKCVSLSPRTITCYHNDNENYDIGNSCYEKKFSGNGTTVLCLSDGCFRTSVTDGAVMICSEGRTCLNMRTGRNGGIVVCSGEKSCRSLYQDGTAACPGVDSCPHIKPEKNSTTRCTGYNSCQDIQSQGRAEVECIGHASCTASATGVLMDSVCAAGFYGFPGREGTGPCTPCPKGIIGRPYPGAGSVEKRCH